MWSMELTTPRLLLREFRFDDHTAVHAFASDPEVVRYTDWGPNDPEETTAFLHEVADSARATPRVRFAMAVVDRGDDLLIGSIDLVTTSSQHRRGKIGYVFARPRWGRGFATEAAIALMRFGFDGLDLHKISATCDPANVASARVLAKCGMHAEGRLRDHLRTRGRWRDRLLFAAISGRPG
jgi:RimJ/RimL family protein N-acetyltransferase